MTWLSAFEREARAGNSTAWARAEVSADCYWGAQTQRSLQHFSIGGDRMPKAVYYVYGYVKKACALVNHAAGPLPGWSVTVRFIGRPI